MKHGMYCHGECYYRPNCLLHNVAAFKDVLKLAYNMKVKQ